MQRAGLSPRGHIVHRMRQGCSPDDKILRRILGDADGQRTLGT